MCVSVLKGVQLEKLTGEHKLRVMSSVHGLMYQWNVSTSVKNSLFLLFSSLMIACVHLDVGLTSVVLTVVPTK